MHWTWETIITSRNRGKGLDYNKETIIKKNTGKGLNCNNEELYDWHRH